MAGSYRSLVLRNMEIAFGNEKSPPELRTLAREHFATLGANLLCSPIKVSKNEPRAADRVPGRCWEDLDGLFSYSHGRAEGVVLDHLATWEIGSCSPSSRRLRPGAPGWERITQPLRNRYLDAHIKKLRARFGIHAL